MKQLLFIPTCLLLAVFPIWAATAVGPYSTPNNPAYGGVLHTLTSKGKTLVWCDGGWAYAGHTPFHWSLTVNGVTTYFTSGKPTFDP